MNTLRLTRRQLAGRFVKGSLFYVLARSLEAKPARAAGRKLKRLVFVSMPEGPNLRQWEPGGNFLTNHFMPAGTGMEYPLSTLSPILAGLEMVKADTIVVGGIANDAYRQSTRTNVDAHPRAMMCLGPGTKDGGGDSFDQVIAPILRGTADHLRPSCQLGIGTSRWGLARKAGQPITGWKNPQEAFDKLFAAAAPSTGTTTQPTNRLSPNAKAKLLVDEHLEQYKELRGLVGKEEQQRIDLNVEALTDLQKRLGATGGAARPPVTGGICSPAEIAATRGKLTTSTAMEPSAKPMMDVAVRALACDVTRMITVQMGHAYGDNLNYGWLGVNEAHHTLAHWMNGQNAQRQPALTKVYRWYHDQVAYLAAQLKATPDPEGGNLLDSTLILTASEFGDGHHLGDHLPVLMIGGKAAGLRTGRVVHFSPNHAAGSKPGGCVPLNRLYLTIANELASGALPAIGDPSLCTGGGLSGLT